MLDLAPEVWGYGYARFRHNYVTGKTREHRGGIELIALSLRSGEQSGLKRD